MKASKKDLSSKPLDVRCCENIARAFSNNNCDFHDYAFNFTVYMIGALEENWPACFDTVSYNLYGPYLEYLASHVESCDFKPYPAGFMYGCDSDDYIEGMKAELRLKYISLVNFIKQQIKKNRLNPS
jgi:hypothetical protein